MRARIYLRKTGRLPTDKEAQTKAVNREISRIRERRGGPLSVDDVIQALALGDEVWLHAVFMTLDEFKIQSFMMQGIDIITMKCVTYDHEFSRHLRNKSKAGVRPRRNAKSKAAISRSKTQASKRRSDSAGVQDSDSDSDSYVASDGVPGGSSNKVRRSSRNQR